MSPSVYDRPFCANPGGRPYSNAYRLWKEGHRYQGKTAWRITVRQGRFGHRRKSRRHAALPLLNRWILLGDGVLVKEDGRYNYHRRLWWLPFLVSVWMSCRFDFQQTVTRLREKCDLDVASKQAIRLIYWAILSNFGEVKQYLKSRWDVNLDECIRRWDTNTKFFEATRDDAGNNIKERLEAANGADRALRGIIGIQAEVDKKQKQEGEFEATKNSILSAIQSVGEKVGDNAGSSPAPDAS